MEFRDIPEEAAFRNEVQEFIQEEGPKAERGLSEAEALVSNWERNRAWFKKLAEKGWIAPAWPKEYGGAGLTTMQQFILNEELALNRVPRPLHLFVGLGWVGPTLILYGSEEQKQRFLPPILKGEHYWCQGFSEPGAGSDLASLQTRAVRDGDDYVINGQKICTSVAHGAHWMILLARTDADAPKHKGISCFIVDMKSPGITVRPLVNMADTHEFNEVFFDNVRVPKENLIGEENRGWYAAVATLDFERSDIGSAVGMRQAVEALVEYAREHVQDHTSTLGLDPLLRCELADRMVEVEVARMLSYRVASRHAKGLVANHEASMTKLFACELGQRIARTGMKVTGLYGQLMPGGEWTPARGRYPTAYLQTVASTIAGGTSEIQRNVIAQRGLGLPRG